MGRIHRRQAETHEVSVEVQVIDGEVLAHVRPPDAHAHSYHVERMPLVDAAAMAARLAERFGVDIAVVDLDDVSQ